MGAPGVPFAPHPDGYANAAELVAGLKAIAPFEISVAAYPGQRFPGLLWIHGGPTSQLRPRRRRR